MCLPPLNLLLLLLLLLFRLTGSRACQLYGIFTDGHRTEEVLEQVDLTGHKEIGQVRTRERGKGTRWELVIYGGE